MRQFERTVRSYAVTDENEIYIRKGSNTRWRLTDIHYIWRNWTGTDNYEALYFLSPVDQDSPESPVSVSSISFDMNWQKLEAEETNGKN